MQDALAAVLATSQPLEGDQFRGDVVLDRPDAPSVDVGRDRDMGEPVPESRRHPLGGCLVTDTVARSDDHPTGRQRVVANLAVKYQTKRDRHHLRRRRVDLVEEQVTLLAVALDLRKLVGHVPVSGPCLLVRHRDAAHIHGLPDVQPEVDDLAALLLAKLADNVRLAETGRTPDHRRVVRVRVEFEKHGCLCDSAFVFAVSRVGNDSHVVCSFVAG